MAQGGLEVNYQNHDDEEEAELEREELERQNEVSVVFQQSSSFVLVLECFFFHFMLHTTVI